jgi:hypothetical protein
MSKLIHLLNFDINQNFSYSLTKVHEHQINQYRLASEKAQTDLIDDLDAKQNDLRQARLQIDLLKSTKTQLEQAEDQNQRLFKTKIFF